MSSGGAGPAMVGPAHLLAKHQERVQADSAARPSSAGTARMHITEMDGAMYL